MYKKNDYFKYAKLLSSEYSTLLSNEAVENKVLMAFDGQLPHQFNNNLTIRESLNKFLLHHYPNETSIKSTFINNVLLKTNNHVSIFELNVGKSRLDLCKINGNSIAYEIKTELDTPKRLSQQMKDYFQVFDRVYLICSVNNLNNMTPHVPKECGIIVYYVTKTGRYVFKKHRNAINSNCISPIAQLSILTKRDLSSFFGCPYFSSKEAMIGLIINSKTDKEINKLFKLCLKYKYRNNWDFLVENSSDILEIDYQWFFKNLLSPKLVYL
ncbi:sce7726 family protein [Paenibacillus sp. DYY-L-2]|uniref:sce7726 family protein n=1 Tax=Paenibacillus sp. DYY-L-2 TaxID=3447013 RepID=UPI003F4F87A9